MTSISSRNNPQEEGESVFQFPIFFVILYFKKHPVFNKSYEKCKETIKYDLYTGNRTVP